jgi:hypothetical protein
VIPLSFGCQWAYPKGEKVMTRVAIFPERSAQGDVVFRAVAGRFQSLAKTVGAALDALASQLPRDETGTMVIVQNHHPDALFTDRQRQRLEELMGRWRAARDSGSTLTDSEEAELKQLVEAELKAAGDRAAALVADPGR